MKAVSEFAAMYGGDWWVPQGMTRGQAVCGLIANMNRNQAIATLRGADSAEIASGTQSRQPYMEVVGMKSEEMASSALDEIHASGVRRLRGVS